MSKTFRPWDIEQRWLLPPSVHELVAPGHLAHFVRDTVREQLDLGAIFSVYQEERGSPPYHPAMMVALLLYAYSRGVYSSRQIARACEERVDIMAVTGAATGRISAPSPTSESVTRRPWRSCSCRCCGCAGRRGWSSSATWRSTVPSSRPTPACTRR